MLALQGGYAHKSRHPSSTTQKGDHLGPKDHLKKSQPGPKGGTLGCFRAVTPLSCCPERQDLELYEQTVSQWLKSINVHLPVDAATGSRLGLTSPLEDPLRNGVAVCMLVNRLLATEAQALAGARGVSSSVECAEAKLLFTKRPATVHQARKNLETALSVLRGLSIPSVYLHSTEQVLKGHSDIIWGLLYHIIQLFPPGAEGRVETSLYTSSNRQGYTAAQSGELERSLLAWMTSLGVLRIANPPPDDTTTPLNAPSCMTGQVLHVPPEDISSPFIYPYIRNGTLLCDIVGLIEGQRLTGVFWVPRTRATCLSNLGRAMGVLRDKKTMSRWYLDTEEEVFAGDKVVILALLEDVHRYYDGVAPRRGLIRKGDSPYLDGKLSSLSDPLWQTTGASKQQRLGLQLQATEMWASLPCPSDFNTPEPPIPAPGPFLPSAQLQSSLLPSPARLQEQLQTQAARTNFSPRAIDTERKQGRSRSREEQSVQKVQAAPHLSVEHSSRSTARDPSPRYVSPQPHHPAARLSHGSAASPGSDFQDNKRTANNSSVAMKDSGGIAKDSGGIAKHNAGIAKDSARTAKDSVGTARRSSSGAHWSADRDGFVPITPAPRMASPSPPTRPMSADGRCMSANTSSAGEGPKPQVLAKWLQFLGVNPPPPLTGDKLEAFCDGTLLCHIVSILSHKTLQGIEWNPKSKASMRHNMEKALSALEKSKHLTLDWLFLCDDLLEGRSAAVLSLLASMKKAYQFFVSTVTKPMAEGLRGGSPLDSQEESLHEMQSRPPATKQLALSATPS
eukprot:GGOE01044776.1.p1 GENE.GGOE01044776.1~~GGOE01044776.1.p1  ORF type:complete len:789 (+),score=137.48 GGOE01044776.1:50-2416(+)